MAKILFEGKEYDTEKIQGFARDENRVVAIVDKKYVILAEYETEELARGAIDYLISVLGGGKLDTGLSPSAWRNVRKFCPFTRSADCFYLINPKGKYCPENVASCQFFYGYDRCGLIKEFEWLTSALEKIHQALIQILEIRNERHG